MNDKTSDDQNTSFDPEFFLDQCLTCLEPKIQSFHRDFKDLVSAFKTLTDQHQDIQWLKDEIAAQKAINWSLEQQLKSLNSRLNSITENTSPIDSLIPKPPDSEFISSQSKDSTDENAAKSFWEGDGYKIVIRLSIVELRDKNHLTFREIADKLNAEGVRTFGKGKQWLPQTVQKIYARMKKTHHASE